MRSERKLSGERANAQEKESEEKPYRVLQMWN